MSVVIAYLMVCSLSWSFGVGTADGAVRDKEVQHPADGTIDAAVDHESEALNRALRGYPALAAIKLSIDWSNEPTCEELSTFHDLMLASRSQPWLLGLVSRRVLERASECGHAKLMLLWARSKLEDFDPEELPAPDEMLREEVDSVEFVHDDDSMVLFEFDEPEMEIQGPRSTAPVTFEVQPTDAQSIEFEVADGEGAPERDYLASGAIGHHFESYLTTVYEGRDELERRFLWATLDYLRGQSVEADKGFKALLELSSSLLDIKWIRRAQVGLARLAFDQQRFAESFTLFEKASLYQGKVLESWLPELVWSAYFAGRDDFLNQLFEWISNGDIHPIALGDALGLVPRILEEQCRRSDALKVTGYLIEAMRSPPKTELLEGISPFKSVGDEIQRSTEGWLGERPYAVTIGWLKERAQRDENTRAGEARSKVQRALAQLLRTRIDMRLGRGLMRCRL